MNKEATSDNRRTNTRMRRTVAGYLVAFLMVSLLISLYINYSSVRTQFIQNELSLYSISGNRLVGNIENGLLYGKSLDRYYGMEGQLKEWAKNNHGIVDAQILSKDQREVYYSLTQENHSKQGDFDSSILLAINDASEDTVGYLNLIVDLKERFTLFEEKTVTFLIGTGILFAVGLIAIGVFYRKACILTEDLKIQKRKVLLFLLLLILILQSIFTAFTYNSLKEFYSVVAQDTATEVQRMVEADLDKVLGQGVRYDQIYQFDQYAAEVLVQAPILEQITLNGSQLEVTVSQEYINGIIRRMLIDMVTILVTSMFIVAEIINLMILSINRKAQKITGTRVYDKLKSIRVSSFFIHVACYLPISFIPIMMHEFTGGRASDFILGLPIMVFFATSFLFTLLAGNLNLRFGWKTVLKTGVILVIASSLMAGFLQNPVALVFARGIYGAAYALVYVAIREFAALTKDRQARSRGLAEVTAGLYAGINIGAVLGSMIYSTAGFLGVFLLSALLGGLSYWMIATHCEEEQGQLEEKEESVPLSEFSIKAYLDWKLIRLALFIIAPLAVTGLFFEYFLPVYAVKMGMPSADIGRAFLVNGLAIAYLAPLMVKYVGRKLSEQVNLILFVCFMGLSFLVFGVWGSYLAILVASAMMGVAEGTALVSQNMILLDIPVAKKLGSSRMLSFYAAARKLAQTAGPQIFALFMLLGYQVGMALFGIAIVITTLLYVASGWTCRKEESS